MSNDNQQLCTRLLPHLQEPAKFYDELAGVLTEEMEPDPALLYRPQPPEELGYADSPAVEAISLTDGASSEKSVELNALLYREGGLSDESHQLTHVQNDLNWFFSVEHPPQTGDWLQEHTEFIQTLMEQLLSSSKNRDYSSISEWITTICDLIERKESQQSFVDNVLEFAERQFHSDEIGYYDASTNYYTLQASVGFNEESTQDRQFFPREQLRQLELGEEHYVIQEDEETGEGNLLLPLNLGPQHEGLLAFFGYVGQDDSLSQRTKDLLRSFRSLVALALGARQSTFREDEGFIIDQVTPLKTSDYFMKRLDQEIERSNRYDAEFSVLVLEIDNLDDIREKHGESAELEAVRKLAQLIQNTFRMVDVACRFETENDQFGIIYPNTSIRGAHTAAQRFDKLVQNPFLTIGDTDIPITIHGGLASYPEKGESADDLIKQARLALYEAKQSDTATLKSSEAIEEEENTEE